MLYTVPTQFACCQLRRRSPPDSHFS